MAKFTLHIEDNPDGESVHISGEFLPLLNLEVPLASLTQAQVAGLRVISLFNEDVEIEEEDEGTSGDEENIV